MKNIKIILTIFLTLLFLNACSSVVEGLSGSKKKGSEEFLVEKKAPLVLPPSFGELPIPKNQTNKNIVKNENRLSIEKMVDESSSMNSNSEKNDSEVDQDLISLINKKDGSAATYFLNNTIENQDEVAAYQIYSNSLFNLFKFFMNI